MSKFKVGDRVRVTIDYSNIEKESIGTIIDEHVYPFVEFDEPVNFGHDGDGLGKDGHCWAIASNDLELVSRVPESSQKPSEPEQEVSQGDVDRIAEKVVESVRSHNVGDSDYSTRTIQPWDIWLEYELNPWDADIIKRVLRNKASQSRKMDYEKIIHVCQERIRQIEEQE